MTAICELRSDTGPIRAAVRRKETEGEEPTAMFEGEQDGRIREEQSGTTRRSSFLHRRPLPEGRSSGGSEDKLFHRVFRAALRGNWGDSQDPR